MDEKQKPVEFSARPFKSGDEANLVDFLNLCYPGGSENIEHWEWLYPRYPSFKNDNVFIIESNNQIIGHRGLQLGEFIIRGKKVPVALLSATAIHPSYQGQGLYTRLHQATLKAAKFRGACLVLAGNTRGSITYNHNKKTGFIEIKRSHTYIKVINYEKFFRAEVSDFIARREKLKSLLQGLEDNLYLYFGKTELSLKELLNENTSTLLVDNKRGRVRIILSENSFPLLVEFTTGGKLRKMKSLLSLLLSRKMKIRFNSLLALGRVAWAGAKMA